MIKFELDVRSAVAVRQALFREQNGYTLDVSCCPTRIIDMRNIIVDIDNQIEETLKNENPDT
ncbi:hypothetical protein OAF61_02115 [Pseudomonadales bacterium]|nr:hypothetical protein [Pseudomonadales bacterium]